MTQAAIYLAVAPKSNTALTTYAAAKRDVDEHGALPVPLHLRNAELAGQVAGLGPGYQYPHNFEGHYVRRTTCPRSYAGGATTSRRNPEGSATSLRARRCCATTKRTTKRNSDTDAQLRGDVAPGSREPGSKPVKMDALRASFEALGFKNVRTYVQSGNVVFEAKERTAALLGPKIGARIKHDFGFDVPVLVLGAGGSARWSTRTRSSSSAGRRST